MSNFKSKLAFFQNAALQQQAYQQQAHQQPVHQQQAHQQQSYLQPIHQQQPVRQQPANQQQSYLQPIHQPQQVNQQPIRQPQPIIQPPSYHQPQYSINRQSHNPTFAQKVNPAPTMQNNNEASIHPSSSKASTASQKPIISNSNFKSKLAFYNQQSTPLVPLHPHPSGNVDHKAPQTVTNENNPENTSSLPNSSVKNDDTQQPKVQPPRQPTKSFKDKIALISTIQQPMGMYDYKKKQNTNQVRMSEPVQTFPDTPVQVFPDQILKKPQDLPPEPHLPSLTAGRARRQARRPPSLEQSNNQPSELPPASPI